MGAALLTTFACTRAWGLGATETLFSFDPQHTAGPAYADGPLLVGADGNFYSTSIAGGVPDNGSVYRMALDGTITLVYSFGVVNTTYDGRFPWGGVVQAADGYLYGITPAGGNGAVAPSTGLLFKVSTAGVFSVVHYFGDTSTDGKNPYGTLVLGPDGTMFGTTLAGGEHGVGTVFKLSAAGQYQQIYSFGPPSPIGPGYFPQAGLTRGNDGNYYGVTLAGGVNGHGTFFRITPDGDQKQLYDFGACATDGGEPLGPLLLGSDGNFYGTTRGGKYDGMGNGGTIFRVTPEGVETVIYTFGTFPDDGTDPWGGLIQIADGSLVGTTACGGPYVDPSDPQCRKGASGGTAFILSPSGVYTQLYAFGAAGDGAGPYAGLTQTAPDTFYGTTYLGGANGFGAAFKLKLDPSLSGPTVNAVPTDCSVPASAGGRRGNSSGALDLSLLLGLVPGLVSRWRRRARATA